MPDKETYWIIWQKAPEPTNAQKEGNPRPRRVVGRCKKCEREVKITARHCPYCGQHFSSGQR